MITLIDPDMFKISAVFVIVAMVLAGMFFVPLGAIPLYLLIFPTLAGIIWTGSRGEEWMN